MKQKNFQNWSSNTYGHIQKFKLLKFKDLRKKGIIMCPSLKMKEHDELHQITNMQLVNVKIIIWLT